MSALPGDQRPPRLAWGLYKRFLLGALVIVLASAAAVSTAALLEVKDVLSKISPVRNRIHAPPGALDGVSAGGPQTILVLGSDRRFSDIKAHIPARSDTMILVRLDPSKRATAVMNVPRDLKVRIPHHGMDKINAAYALGGPLLSVATVRSLLHVPINHVVNINFGGFRRAVDRIGCVYVDVDRHYFNDNNPPAGGGGDYATIDVKAGYQKLCGQDALDYVRYRHFDTDLVRAARQQDFLRQAKDQVGFSKLFGDRDALLRIFGRYTQTDIASTTAVLRLLKLAFESASKPVQQIHFPAVPSGDFLTISDQDLARTRDAFMNARGTQQHARGKARVTRAQGRLARRQQRKRTATVPVGLFDAKDTGENLGIQLGVKTGFPVYYPRYAAVGSRYEVPDSRAYDLYDRSHKRYRAYRMVVAAPGVGQYYGVQGTTWKAPPILDDPSEVRHLGGKRLELYFDGRQLRLVAWRTDRAVYWVSNTLLESLTNRQMLGIAQSLRRVGS